MYYCKYCGYSTQRENINWCNNTKCMNYGYKEQPSKDCYKDSCMEMPKPCYKDTRNDDCKYRYDDKDRCKCDCKEKNFCDYKHSCDCKEKPRKDCDKKIKCDCDMPDIPCNDKLPLGLSVTPMQKFCEMYQLEQAIKVGTIFPELDMPYDKRIIRRDF